MPSPKIAQLARAAVLNSGVLIEGHFVFADGDHAFQKLEMDNLWEHPDELKTIIQLLAEAEGLPEADLIIGVPTGGQRLAALVVTQTHIPFIELERVPGGAKQDFQFLNLRDKKRALDAHSPRIYEDVVTTLSSIAGVVRLLNPSLQDIHSFAIWRRGEVKPQYAEGVTQHYLVEEPIETHSPEDCPLLFTPRA